MGLAGRRLSPRLAAIVGAATLAISAGWGYVDGGDFGDVPTLSAADGASGTEGPAPGRLVPRTGTGSPAPDFALDAFDGQRTVSLADFAGTPLVVNFWASWCPFCIAEMPGLEAVHQRFGGAVAFLGVDIQDDRGLAADLIERTGVTYEIVEDPDGSLFRDAKGVGMPTTLLVTSDGRVAQKITGPIEADELEEAVLRHLVREEEA